MNPNPLLSLNHFTLPVTSLLPFLSGHGPALLPSDRGRPGRPLWPAFRARGVTNEKSRQIEPGGMERLLVLHRLPNHTLRRASRPKDSPGPALACRQPAYYHAAHAPAPPVDARALPARGRRARSSAG